jgi:hypothetical protein
MAIIHHKEYEKQFGDILLAFLKTEQSPGIRREVHFY